MPDYIVMKPHRSLSRVLAALVVLANTVMADSSKAIPAANHVEVLVKPAFIEVEDVPGLPRILLIGDSISIGYTLPVRAKLKGVANVHRPLENCGDTARVLARLDVWIGSGRWDVIHFNVGLHDLKYMNAQGHSANPENARQVTPPEMYRQRLRDLTLRLKATGAQLIFATTTPVPPGALGRVAGDEVTYNAIALNVMDELDVPVDDLFAFVAAQQQSLPPRPLSEKPVPPQKAKRRAGEIQLPYDVHFTPKGYELLADQVVESITRVLPIKY